MKARTRFIQSIVETSGNNDIQMPWARGSRRAAFIARRDAANLVRRSA